LILISLGSGFQKSEAAMARGGRREGAGRPRGSTSRRTHAGVKLLPARAHQEQKKFEDLPLDILMWAARDEAQPIEIRLAAARAAAPFFHAKPSSGPPKGSFEMTLSELETAIEREKEYQLRAAPGRRTFQVVGSR
jgi:hypothetical protein